MTIADQSHSSDEFPNGIEAHGEKAESGQHPVANQEVNSEAHRSDSAPTDPAEPDQQGETAEVLPPVEPGDHTNPSEDAAPIEFERRTETAPVAELAQPSEAPQLVESDPVAESGPAAEPLLPTESAVSTEDAPPAETSPAAESAQPAESALSTEAAPLTETAPLAEFAQPSEAPQSTEPAPPTDTGPATEPLLPTESALSTEAALQAEAAPPTESAPPSEAAPLIEPAPPTEIAPAAEATLPVESAFSTGEAPPADQVPPAESSALAESVKPNDAAQSTEPASLSEAAQPGETGPVAELATPAQLAPLTEPALSTESAPPTEPESSQASAILLFVAIFLVFSALIAVGAALTLGRADSAAAPDPASQPQPAPAPETKVLGTVDSSAAGVKGHLTTKWDAGLKYNFVIEPDDPARQPAFALLVSNPPRPTSVRVQIKNSDGVVVCSQDVLLKFDPRKAAAISDASTRTARGKPLGANAAEELKGERDAELAREDATEADRERGKSIFQLNTGSDGKIESISSQGEIPCPQVLYEGMGYWSFLPDFPSAEEQTERLNRQTAARADATEGPKPETVGHKRMP